ncbi:TonB-dependent receptor [Sediminitomix flava]|uniref:Outer membrane receptor for ferrienterochelin and colicins n=1 Tax=Sediminitomix flava TaxID=379075 RepID=A0A315Z9R7_SEDFL|nr:TonB-dependent receptor [Sediminitomix flava]PWJ42316.1 outer membrane receptor for ferrienterochelin and colicins [Sediminitomix flava]
MVGKGKLFLIQTLLILVSLAQLSYAKDQTSFITGHIDSKNGHIPFATVYINELQLGTTSDDSGHFYLKNVPFGEYQITISAVGYRKLTETVSINKKNQDLKFKLEEDLIELESVVVSGNRTAQSRKETPAVVNVIGSKVFEVSASKVIADGLNFVPGARVENTCSNCGSTSLRLNGLEGPYTQILIDSRPIFNSLVGVYGLEQLPVSMIERVEVVRGGGSVLFGANAIGGTVNVITKEPKFNRFEVGTQYASINGEAYDVNTSFNTSVVSNDDKTSLILYGSHRKREAWNATPNDKYYTLVEVAKDEFIPNYDEEFVDDFSNIPELRNLNIGTKIIHKINNRNKVTAKFNITDEFRRGGNKFDLAPHLTDITEQLEHQIIGGGINYDWISADQRSNVSFYSSVQSVVRDSYYGAEMQLDGYGKTTSDTYVVGTQFNRDLGHVLFAPAFFIGGVEYINDNIKDRKLGYFDYESDEFVNDIHISDQLVQTIAVFAQNEWKGDRLSLLLGARLDHVMINDYLAETDKLTEVSAFNPRVNLKYNIGNNLQARVGFATGFRAPQIFNEDMHIDIVAGDQVRTILADDLTTERSYSYNFALDWDTEIGGWQSYFLLEGFHTKIEDRFLNEFVEGEEGNYYLKRNSENDAFVQGINVEAKLAASSKFNVQTGFTFQTAKYNGVEQWGDEDDSATDRILRTPNNYGSLSMNYYPKPNLLMSLSGVYTGSMYVPHMAGGFYKGVYNETEELVKTEQFFDLGIRLAYDVQVSKDLGMQIGGGVKNIFNQFQRNFDSGPTKDAAFVYGPAAPRTFYLEVKFSNLLN